MLIGYENKSEWRTEKRTESINSLIAWTRWRLNANCKLSVDREKFWSKWGGYPKFTMTIAKFFNHRGSEKCTHPPNLSSFWENLFVDQILDRKYPILAT